MSEYTSNAPLARYQDTLGLPPNEGKANTPAQEKAHRAEQQAFQEKMAGKRMKPMSAEEHAAQHREENESSVKQYKYIDQHELEGFCQGKILSHQQFMDKLRLIRPDAFYNDFSRMGRIGINIVELGQAKYTGTTVQFGLGPEFSQVGTDAHGVGQAEKYRGWRTTLTHLIARKFVTEDQVNRVFGLPGHTRAMRYQKNLWEFRNLSA